MSTPCEMPKPGAEHKQLQKLVGNWVGEEKIAPAPWDPGGGTAVGRVTNRIALDGFAVVQDYEQERSPGQVNFRGHGVFTYDAKAKSYVLHWWDSMGSGGQEFRGQFEGDVLACTSKGPMGYCRCSFDVSKPGRYVFKMDVSQDGERWMNAMEGGYSKKG